MGRVHEIVNSSIFRRIAGEWKQAFALMKSDIDTVLSRDPAARTRIEVALVYPGLHALWLHRLAHVCWKRRSKILARMIASFNRFMTGVEIHPAAMIGKGFFIDHGMGVVIGETASIGKDVTIYHGVTLGGTSLQRGKRHPTVGDRVTIGAGAKILGNITIGSDSRIGANAVVVKNVPPNSVVVGIPGHAMRRHLPHTAEDEPDLHHEKLPDVLGQRIHELSARIAVLEEALLAMKDRNTLPSRPEHASMSRGSWSEVPRLLQRQCIDND